LLDVDLADLGVAIIVGREMEQCGVLAEYVMDRCALLLPDRLSAMVYLAAGCGLRLGEPLGLEVGDVDFERREVHEWPDAIEPHAFADRHGTWTDEDGGHAG
jgi:hypothetical protein